MKLDLTLNQKIALLVGACAIAVITGILYPPQPQSMILSMAFYALWCAYIITLHDIPTRER